MDTIFYYYFGGLIFLGLERYQDAIRAFKKVMITPTKSITDVHISAYKKLVLLGFIEGFDFELGPTA